MREGERERERRNKGKDKGVIGMQLGNDKDETVGGGRWCTE